MTYEKKPLWQRVGASIIVVLGSGCFIGGVLLTRRRNVRVIDLVQRGKAFYVETAADDLGSGKTFERKDCVISPNRSECLLAFNRGLLLLPLKTWPCRVLKVPIGWTSMSKVSL